jgi:hypothetical protein
MRNVIIVLVRLVNVYKKPSDAGTVVKPNPGRSGAITWWVSERRGARLRNM